MIQPINGVRADIQPTVVEEEDRVLVITRRIGEKIMIGDDIVLTVVDILGNKVRVGIDAPKHVRIDRMEVHLENQRLAEIREKLGRGAGPNQGQ